MILGILGARAVTATNDTAVLEASVLIVRRIVRQLEILRESIAEHDKTIAELAQSHPDYGIFSSLPGAGPAMTPRLIAAFGTQRDRYATASALQCYAGIAPVTESSGKQKWVHWRWACPKFLRQTFHELAWLSTRKSDWARTFYDQQRRRNKSHHGAVRALSFKWLRILWQKRAPGIPLEKRRRFHQTRWVFRLTSQLRCLCPSGTSIRKRRRTPQNQRGSMSVKASPVDALRV